MGLNQFLPSSMRQAIEGNPYAIATTAEVALGSNDKTVSWFYDADDAPLKSTQQLNVDWSKFENHTFFMSAEVKTNLAFDQVINSYPFDGTQREVENFLDGLGGFERYVFESFPRYRGAIELVSTAGRYIAVQDTAGYLFPGLAKRRDGAVVINPPTDKSLSIELQIFLPAAANTDQVICQKTNGATKGFSLHLLASLSTSTVTCEFAVSSVTFSSSVQATLKKGEYNHVCVVLDRGAGVNSLKIYVAEKLVAETPPTYHFDRLDIDESVFYIGHGSTIQTDAMGTTFTPANTLSATLDEFRIFHSVRTPQLQSLYASKGIFSTDDLKLYFKFNEPAGIGGASNIVLDSSGNSLHGVVVNPNDSMRVDASTDPLSPMVNEKIRLCPVLFPAYPDVVSLNVGILSTASEYDKVNPNIITRLIPPHYLLEGAYKDGFGKNVDGNATGQYGGSSIPGSGDLGSQQILLSFLYMWARFFDDIKVYVDQFANLEHVEYSGHETTPDNFLLDFTKRRGLNLPNLFTHSSVEQYLSGENILREVSTSENSLKYVRSELMKRVMVSLPKIMSSKGTPNSIKYFLRAIGVDPDNTIKIREYGGPTYKNLSYTRESDSKLGTMLNIVDNSYVVSPFLSSSRSEPGSPPIAGSWTPVGGQVVSDNPNDGLLTSGSWTLECVYRPTATQVSSLARMMATGSGGPWVLANLVATPQADVKSDSNITLYLRPTDSLAASAVSMSLAVPGQGIFDGRRWAVSFGKFRPADVGQAVTSSYFIRAASEAAGNIVENYESTMLFDETAWPGSNSFSQVGTYNASGSYILLGNYYPAASVGARFLNDSTYLQAQASSYLGLLSSVRFYSKGVTQDEWKEHVRNQTSIGVVTPSVNFSTPFRVSGSFERPRINAIQKQAQVLAAGLDGHIDLVDETGDGMGLTGYGFSTVDTNFQIEFFDRGYLSPYYDESVTNEKVRARGFQSAENLVEAPWAQAAPVHSIQRELMPTDSPKLSVDFSLVDALNCDIVNMFANYDDINRAMGSPNLLYSEDYPGMSTLRETYFSKLLGKVDFASFFEYYKWFDDSVGVFIDQIVPRKAAFKGVNFVIEPHMLERSKHRYPPPPRPAQADSISATVRKF